MGFDKVIITAAAPTNDPIELSAEIARKKGQILLTEDLINFYKKWPDVIDYVFGMDEGKEEEKT